MAAAVAFRSGALATQPRPQLASRQLAAPATGPSCRRGRAAAPPRAGGSSSSSDKPTLDRATGFIEEDNSGRANIFPTRAQPYLESSRADAAAKQGLGGLQGGALVGIALAAVAAATLFSAKTEGPETLARVGAQVEGESLAVIAGRIKSSL